MDSHNEAWFRAAITVKQEQNFWARVSQDKATAWEVIGQLIVAWTERPTMVEAVQKENEHN